MVRPLLATGLLTLAACTPYAPAAKDCAIRCGAQEACPHGLSCAGAWCRLAGSTTSCDCQVGDVRPCGGGKGECTAGEERCTSAGVWSGTCIGAGQPPAEVCDGKDNDCDGVVDDAVTNAPACDKTEGVCGLARQACVDGGFVPCTVASYGPDYEAVETRCDGKDNDCDGLLDALPATTLVANARADFALFGYPNGFALAYSADEDDGGVTVAVARFDATLAATGTQVVAEGMPDPTMAAAAVSSTVSVVWQNGRRLSAARALLDGGVVALPGVPDSGYADQALSVGASDRTMVAGYLADGQVHVRAVQWNVSAGDAVSQRNLNVSGGVVQTSTAYVVTVSKEGGYVVLNADSASKPILLGTFTPDVLAGTDVIEADGGILIASQDVPGTQVWLAQTAGIRAGTTFRKRALGAGGGDGIPRLAPAGKAPWFMLATGPAGGVSARLVCAP